jgi:hypothetical protein
MVSNEAQIILRDLRVSNLDPNALKSCLMELGYFPEANILPPIYKLAITNSGNVSKQEADPVSLFVTKSKQKWRDFKILKPENYMQVVNLLIDNYADVSAHFLKSSRILSYSTPVVYNEHKKRPGLQISNWTDMQEHMLAASSENRLTHLVQLDIQSCYETLYTHTLEWAMGKLGKKFDKGIRSGNNRRTHGLPIGPYISDILAEIVLCWVDRNIEKALNRLDYLGYRYKDNYYFLAKGSSECEKILSITSEELRNAHFTLNDSKTKIGLYTDYHLSMWQTDHKLLIQSLGLKSKNAQFTNEKLQVFIDQSLKISEVYGNSTSILEKTINYITEGDFKGIISYSTLFYSITGMLPLRTLSYPKVLAYLKKLSEEHPLELTAIYKKFIINEISGAYDRKDAFALMWIVYILADFEDDAVKVSATEKLEKIRRKSRLIKDVITYVRDPSKDITLWNENISQIKLSRNDYLGASELFDYLGISFAES